MKWLERFRRRLKPYKVCAFGQDATETKTGYGIGHVGMVRYEINVAFNGKHLFATDSTIRNYTDSHIAYLIGEFSEKFPGCTITVSAHRKLPVLPSAPIAAALDGSIDMDRLAKELRREEARVGLARSDDYFGDETSDEVCRV